MTRAPLFSDWAAFSPSWAQATMLKYDVFSCHSPFCW